MQIKSNQEVRNYHEQVYFGLTLRQLVFTGLAGAAAVLVFFLGQAFFSMETVSWLCILAALPFAAFGFIRWHGMYFEEIIQVIIRAKLVLGRPLYFRPQNEIKAFVFEYEKEKERDEKNAAKRKNTAEKTS